MTKQKQKLPTPLMPEIDTGGEDLTQAPEPPAPKPPASLHERIDRILKKLKDQCGCW